ncbi:MAG: hypothetical protein JXJ17_05240 [Anaerolineae bacterium]|nr:hypothetical protein [Anaerolineae bacterium]
MLRKPPSRRQVEPNATPEERQAALEEGRRKANRQGIIRSVIMLIFLTVIAVYMAIKPRDPQVLSITTAAALDDNYEAVDPTDTYAPGDTFFVSVEVIDFPQGADLTARWRYEGEVIRETVFESEVPGSGFVGFVLDSSEPWPEARYSVEIMYEGEVLDSTQFWVRE